MRIAFSFVLMTLLPRAWGADSAPQGRYVPYFSANHAFSCQIPSDWIAFEEETPRGSVVHILGPVEAHGSYRAALHIHYFERDKPGFVPWQESLAPIRARKSNAERESTSMSSWRIAKKPAKLFEVKEKRALPAGRLPAELISLHHFYALVPGAGQDYFLIRLSSTEATYLDYRDEFKRFLKSFRITGSE